MPIFLFLTMLNTWLWNPKDHFSNWSYNQLALTLRITYWVIVKIGAAGRMAIQTTPGSMIQFMKIWLICELK